MSIIQNALEKMAKGEYDNKQGNNEVEQDHRPLAPPRKLRPDEDTLRGRAFVHSGGSRQGHTEVVDYTIEVNGHYSVVFKSGIQMAVDELNIRMLEAENVENYNKKIAGLKPDSSINAIDESTVILPDVAPIFTSDPPLPDEFERISVQMNKRKETSVQETGRIVTNKEEPIDPFQLLYKKMKKIPVDLSMSFSIDIPSKDVLTIILDNFEEDSLKIIDYIINEQNIEDIKRLMKDQILEYYEIKKEEVLNDVESE